MDTLAVQRALAAAGFDPGPLDGIPGKLTTAAVKAFQKARGLAVDGIVGPGTTAALGLVVEPPAPDQKAMLPLLITDVRRLCPQANPLWSTALITGWSDVCRLAELTTPSRARHFLAQTAEESGGFRVFQEDLYGYTAARLMQVWPSKFRSLAAATPYAHNPQGLAEMVYGMRADLGNTQPGDGWKYHGMGPIQVTGRAWATKLAAATGLDLINYPETMLQPDTGWKSSAACWQMMGANPFVDRGDFLGETRRINGGLTNLAERQRYLALANTITFRADLTHQPQAPQREGIGPRRIAAPATIAAAPL